MLKKIHLEDGVVLVYGEPDALQRGEGSADVQHVGRQLEQLSVAAGHLFHYTYRLLQRITEQNRTQHNTTDRKAFEEEQKMMH